MLRDDSWFDLVYESSLEAPLRVQAYADSVEEHLRERYPETSGYTIRTKQREDRSERRWEVAVLRGWTDGANVVIRSPKNEPNRAEVRIDFDSRIQQALQYFALALGMVLSVIVLIVAFLTVGTLIGFIVGGVLGVVTAGVIAVAAGIFSLLLGKLTGATFDTHARTEMGRDLQTLETAPRKS